MAATSTETAATVGDLDRELLGLAWAACRLATWAAAAGELEGGAAGVSVAIGLLSQRAGAAGSAS